VISYLASPISPEHGSEITTDIALLTLGAQQARKARQGLLQG